MAILKLTGATTIAELKKQFNEAFGSQIKVYAGNKVADVNETLSTIGLTKDGEFECRSSITVASFIERIKTEFGIKLKVYTCDEWVAVLDGLTLESSGKVKKNAVKADMESMIAYQRTEGSGDNLNGYKIVAEENGGYVVYQNDTLCNNAKGAMREIAALIGFEVDPAWTTRQLGAKLLKAIDGGTTSAPKPAVAMPQQKDYIKDDIEEDDDEDIDEGEEEEDIYDGEWCENIDFEDICYTGIPSDRTASAAILLLDDDEDEINIPSTITDDNGGEWTVTGYEITDGNYSTLNLPDTITEVMGNAFSELPDKHNLTINIAQGNKYLKNKNGVIISTLDRSRKENMMLCNTQTTILYGNYTVPNGVKIIDHEAFINQEQLTSLTLPESVVELGIDCVKGCANLKEIIIHNKRGNVQYWSGKVDEEELTPLGDQFCNIKVTDIEKKNTSVAADTGISVKNNAKKGFRRLPDKGLIAGVCAGLGSYLGVNAWVIRILFIIFASSAVSIILYIILAIIMKSGD